MSRRIRICDLIKRELDDCRRECNFTPDELIFFNLRAKDKSITEICGQMHIKESKATSLSNKVNAKIFKVLQ